MAKPLIPRVPAPPGAAPASMDAVPLGGTRREAMRRLQMGLVGVVAVLLLIGLASIVKDRAAQTESTAVDGAAPTTAPSSAPTTADPLAEAGVLPDIPASPTVSPTASGEGEASPPPNAN